VAVAARVPPAVSYRAAGLVGLVAYALSPARRSLARANLARVCAWLEAHGTGSPRARAAAGDPRRLEALVRDVFRHWVVTYLESAVAPSWPVGRLRERVTVDDRASVDRVLRPVPPGGVGRVYVGLHFGSAELAALYATRYASVPLTGPMEQVRGRLAAAWFARVRGRYGVALVPIEGSARTLRRTLERGEGVALIADRDRSGDGTLVELFGAPARLPAGPAVLAARTGAPLVVLGLRRTRPGRWHGRVVELEAPAGSPARDAARHLLDRQARAFEGTVAEAPEQWWTLLFPIWEDGAGRTSP
jgi:phosphatidylinositol dimannoside acyltransferase